MRNYILQHFTERELEVFDRDLEHFMLQLKQNPKLLSPTLKRKEVYQGTMNRYTIVQYRWRSDRQEVQMLGLRSSREIKW